MGFFVLFEGFLWLGKLPVEALFQHESDVVQTRCLSSLRSFLVAKHSAILVVFTVVKVSALLESLRVISSFFIVPMRSFDIFINSVAILVHLSQVKVTVGENVGMGFCGHIDQPLTLRDAFVKNRSCFLKLVETRAIFVLVCDLEVEEAKVVDTLKMVFFGALLVQFQSLVPVLFTPAA